MVECKDIRDPDNRILSLDFFRGCVMLLLIGEAAGVYDLLLAPALEGSILYSIGLQFQHHPWNGLQVWDLGQPLFMFISGAAMVFSYNKRWTLGMLWRGTFIHALTRSLLLFFLGWAIYRIEPVPGSPCGAFLYDIFPQLAVGGLVAFLVLKWPISKQLGLAFGLIAVTELLYRLWPVPGFNEPFVPGRNFGSYVDRLIMGSVSEDNWVAFNMVPAAAFMIWGAVAGRFLKEPGTAARKVRVLFLAGCGGVAAGLALSSVTPVIRRINTSSFIILCGGLCLLSFALACWLMEVLKVRKPAVPFLAVGMNPLLIYLFAQTGGAAWLEQIVAPFSIGLFGWAGGWPAEFATSIATLGLMGALCYWLYRKKIFIKI
jgi:predicted acyltransferase